MQCSITLIATEPRLSRLASHILLLLCAAFPRGHWTLCMLCQTCQLLEACVKNCVPFFFQQLIYSDLWHDILRAGEPTRNVSEHEPSLSESTAQCFKAEQALSLVWAG
jgi:hypothetical protein